MKPTAKKLDEPTIDEMRIAACEWMGWTRIIVEPKHIIRGFSPGRGVGYRIQIPPLTLDWIAECEKRLEIDYDGSPAADYHESLWNVVNPYIPWEKENLTDVAYLQNFICATAEQRLIALYRTIKP